MNFIKIREDVSDLSDVLRKQSGRNLIVCKLGKVAICERKTKPESRVFRQSVAYFYDPDGNAVPAERIKFQCDDGEEVGYAIADVTDSTLYAEIEFFYDDDIGVSTSGSVYFKFWRKENGDIKVKWLDPSEVPFLVPDGPDWDDFDDLDDLDDLDDEVQE